MVTEAEPVLASAIWSSLQYPERDVSIAPARLATGLPDLDKALNGGLEYGGTTCVTAEGDNDIQHLVFGLITSHLITGRDANVTLISSTLSVNVKRLHAYLTTSCTDRLPAGEVAAEALVMLDRVKIMKVFDFVGLTESLNEFRNDLGYTRNVVASEALPIQNQNESVPSATIKDSQAEDEDTILDESPAPFPQAGASSIQEAPNLTGHMSAGTNLLIIDNIAHLASPLLKNNHTQGQALLTSFMRSTHHLTKQHHICTVLLNNAISYSQRGQEPSPSIFSSCALRPALGKTFTHQLDLHLLVHRVPRTVGDAKVMYGDQTGDARTVGKSTVVEVLQDRVAERVGRWAVIATGT